MCAARSGRRARSGGVCERVGACDIRDEFGAAAGIALRTVRYGRRTGESSEHPLQTRWAADDFQRHAAALQHSQRAAKQSGGLGARREVTALRSITTAR